ncbi:MAG TPA: hypothetical protein VF171_08800 [Trueperaceae bacterium]
MRAGFVTQLLWSRYGPFWEKLLSDMGAEIVLPDAERTRRIYDGGRLDEIPAVAFRLAAAQALALEGVDVLVAPDLNPGEEVPRGGGQDPWIASFPDALAKTLGGLPNLVAVPAELGPGLEKAAVSTLHAVAREPALVRRVWERHRTLARPPRYAEPRWQPGPGARHAAGVVGQPWLLDDALVARLQGTELHLVPQHRLDPALLRREGAQVDARLIGTDSEVLGAARYLERKGSISELIMVADRGSGADMWLAGRVERSAHKPFRVVYLDDLAPEGEVAALLAPGS